MRKLLSRTSQAISAYMGQGEVRVVSLASLLCYTLEFAGLALIAGAAVKHFRYPATQPALLAYNAVLVAGALVILYCSGRRFIRNISRLRILCYGATSLTVMLSAIGNFGDDAVKEPGALAAIILVVASCQIVAAMCRLAGGEGEDRPPAEARFGTVVARTTQEAGEQDRRFIAAHEAGHALVYAAWSPLPDGLRVVVKRGSDGSNSLGFVNDGLPRRLLNEKDFAEWDMLLSLAGIAGEKCYMGHVTQGAVNDALRWMNIAGPYLSCHLTGGVYYPEPASELEISVNQRHLTALRSAQSALLEVFFERNRSEHARLTDALLKHGELTGADLHIYLAGVELPEGFPQLQNDNAKG